MKSAVRPAPYGRPPAVLIAAALALAVALVVAMAPGARAGDARAAAGGLDTVAEALKDGPVHVDPRASDQLSGADARALADRIERADKPLFVAVLPKAAEFPPETVLQDLRTKVGVSGVYAVVLGDRFAAAADNQVMPRDAVANLSGAAERSADGDTAALLDEFTDGAAQQARGNAPAAWDAGGGGGGSAAPVLLVLLGLLVVAVGGGLLVRRRGRRRRAEEDRAELEKLRPVVDEDITAFGEELDRIGFEPAAPDSDDAMRRDYTEALDAYDRAKRGMETARGPEDVRPVTRSLEDGRFALATLEARRDGAPLPERRLPCFFDPRHGPSVRDAEWAPAGGAERTVPVCAADAARLADGEEPMARTVETAGGRRPYWEAGPVYAPWAGGYFGGGLLPGMLVGTMLGSALYAPSAYASGTGGAEGGDVTGADFEPGDFGGFDGGGGFGGGDFGGGGF